MPVKTNRISQWWSSVGSLPRWGQPLQNFLSGTIGITAGLLLKDKMPRIVWEDIDTAYANQEDRYIGISSNMLSEDEEKRPNKSADKSTAISAVLGTLVHEVAHFVFSPAKLTGGLNASVPVNNLSLTLANIVEDLFIERAIVDIERSFDWMISECWRYFFPDSDIESRLAGWDGSDLSDLSAILNVMIAWKRGDWIFEPRSDFEKKLYDLTVSARGMYQLQDRKNLTEKLYRLLLDEHKEQTGEDMEKEMADAEAEGDEAMEKLGELIKKLLQEMTDTDNKSMDTEGELIEVNSSGRRGRDEAIKRFVMDQLVDFSVAGSLPVAWVKAKQSSVARLKYPEKWKQFKVWAADQGTLRRIRGHASMKGKLTHPSNLQLTGEVFSKARTASPNGANGVDGAPQEIILIDMSGSMGNNVFGSSISKMSGACETAQGAMEGLLAAGHRVAVFGHTTEYVGAGSENAVIYIMKEFSETVEAGSNALRHTHEAGAMGANGDSYAIEAVCSRFKRDGSPMRLWVVSDGQPACDLYRGKDAIRMTKDVVTKMRKQGIEVRSFSIDRSAMSANNEIYGVKSNYDAQDQDVVRKVLKEFV